MKEFKWKIPITWRNGNQIRFVDYRINKEGIVKRTKDCSRVKSGKIVNIYNIKG